MVFFLADVSGHGSSSAFATVLLKNLFARKRSAYLRQDDHDIINPLKMLGLANSELLELAVNKYATMVVGVLDLNAQVLRYSIAGHLPQPIMITDEDTYYLPGEGSPVGLLPDPRYAEQVIALPDRFILSVLSDGVLETMTDINLIEKEEYLLASVAGPVAKPIELARRLGLEDLARTEVPDDIAGLFISRALS